MQTKIKHREKIRLGKGTLYFIGCIILFGVIQRALQTLHFPGTFRIIPWTVSA